MSKQIHQEPEELKQHGDPLANAIESSSIPSPEDGGHAKSHAAHLGGAGREHTKPAGGLQQGVNLGELREPPMVTNRVGKEHRKQ
jgi:hypothetical protein